MFLVLEGLDGAGKSTQIKMLKARFEAEGKMVKYLHFPRFETPVFGDLIARFLRGDIGSNDAVHPILVALLFAGDRGEAASLINRWLKDGYSVILDRYIHSNIAFQCAKVHDEKQSLELREWILNTEYNYFSIPKPDIALFLDVPLKFVEERLSDNRVGEDRSYLEGKQDIHEEKLSFQIAVREIYLRECAMDSGLHRVNCADKDGNMLSSKEIFNEIIANI